MKRRLLSAYIAKTTRVPLIVLGATCALLMGAPPSMLPTTRSSEANIW